MTIAPFISSQFFPSVAPSIAWSFPITDWQFWVVSLIALLAAAYLLRAVLPIPWLSKRHQQRKRERRVPLTIKRDET